MTSRSGGMPGTTARRPRTARPPGSPSTRGHRRAHRASCSASSPRPRRAGSPGPILHSGAPSGSPHSPATPGPPPPGQPTTSSTTGPPTRGPEAATAPTFRQARGPSSGPRCAGQPACCTGREPRPRRTGAATWTARSNPASAQPERYWRPLRTRDECRFPPARRPCPDLAPGETMRAEAAGKDWCQGMDGGQLLAVLLALAGSGCYAVAVVTQQGVAARLPSERAFDPAVLVRLARRPVWLAGLAAVIVGFGLQAAALGLGRLVLIEPVLATGLLFALALAARRDRRSLSRPEWTAVLAVVAGLAVFLTVGHPTGGQRTASVVVLALAVAAAAGLIGLCTVLACRFSGSRRALLFGVGGGVAAGSADALVKSVTVLAAGRQLAVFTDGRLYLLIAVGLLTYTIQQNGYRAAALAAFLPAFAVIEPVSGSLFGLIVYHERLSARPGQIAGRGPAGLAAAGGIARPPGSAEASGPQPAQKPASPGLAPPAEPGGQHRLAVSAAADGTDES